MPQAFVLHGCFRRLSHMLSYSRLCAKRTERGMSDEEMFNKLFPDASESMMNHLREQSFVWVCLG